MNLNNEEQGLLKTSVYMPILTTQNNPAVIQRNNERQERNNKKMTHSKKKKRLNTHRLIFSIASEPNYHSSHVQNHLEAQAVPRIVAKAAVVQIHTAQPVTVDTVQSVEKTPRLVVGVDPAVAQKSTPAVDEVGKVALLHMIVAVVVRRSLVDGSRTVVLKLVEGVGIEVAPLGRGQNNALEVVAGEVGTMDPLCMGTGFDRQVRRQAGMGLGASYDGWVAVE